MIGARGHRKWRAFWWDADGKHSRVIGRAWAQSSGRRTPRGAVVWHAADGPKPDASYVTPKEAEAELRRILERVAAKTPTPRNSRGRPVTFADAAGAWLRHGEVRRNLQRSTVRDYRQALDAYLLPAQPDAIFAPTAYGRAPFAEMPLRDLTPDVLKAWHDELPHGRTTEKLLMMVRAILQWPQARLDRRQSSGRSRAHPGPVRHRIHRHAEKRGSVTVAGKPGQDVPAGTLGNILRQAGLRRPKQ